MDNNKDRTHFAVARFLLGFYGYIAVGVVIGGILSWGAFQIWEYWH